MKVSSLCHYFVFYVWGRMGLHRCHSPEQKQQSQSVIRWMPAATIYFSDLDNHLIEYLSMLDHNPRPDLGIIPWSEWLAKS